MLTLLSLLTASSSGDAFRDDGADLPTTATSGTSTTLKPAPEGERELPWAPEGDPALRWAPDGEPEMRWAPEGDTELLPGPDGPEGDPDGRALTKGEDLSCEGVGRWKLSLFSVFRFFSCLVVWLFVRLT